MKRALFLLALAFVCAGASLESEKKKESLPVLLEVTPMRLDLKKDSPEVTIKWCAASHPNNVRYSLVMNSDNHDYKMLASGKFSEANSPVCGVNDSLLTQSLREGLYVFEACVYRRLDPGSKEAPRICYTVLVRAK